MVPANPRPQQPPWLLLKMTTPARTGSRSHDTAIHALGAHPTSLSRLPINVGCCVWCWVIFSYFSVPPAPSPPPRVYYFGETLALSSCLSRSLPTLSRGKPESHSWRRMRAGASPRPRRRSPVATRSGLPFEKESLPHPGAAAARSEEPAARGEQERVCARMPAGGRRTVTSRSPEPSPG